MTATRVDIERRGDAIVVRLAGALVAADAEAVTERVAEHAFAADSRVAIDLSKLDTLDSSGLSALIHLVTRARLSQGRVVLVSPSQFVSGIFAVTRLNQYFEIFDNLDSAVDSLVSS